MFMASFNAAVDSYGGELKTIPNGEPIFPTRIWTRAAAVRPGDYSLADEAYADLLDRLTKTQFKDMSPELRANILNYYADTSISFATKKNPKEWTRTLADLDAMKSAPPSAAPTSTASRF